MLKTFIHDESGAVTVDYVVFLGGVATMALTIVSDIAQATMSITDRINERTSYESIIAEIEQSYGTDRPVVVGNNDSDSGDSSTGSGGQGYGNPGNDKDVGKAGENPNGKGGWGNGRKGRSE